VNYPIKLQKPHPPPHLVLRKLVVFHSSLFKGLALDVWLSHLRFFISFY